MISSRAQPSLLISIFAKLTLAILFCAANIQSSWASVENQSDHIQKTPHEVVAIASSRAGASYLHDDTGSKRLGTGPALRPTSVLALNVTSISQHRAPLFFYRTRRFTTAKARDPPLA